jgi:branched-chain amino acid transport system ATP-binding protein
MLEVRDLAVAYGAIDAVRGVSLTAPRGKVTALIGANGAGKSSLLSAVAGIVTPRCGAVLLDGQDVTGVAPHRRARLGLSYAMEGRRLFHQHTVEENLVTAWHFRRTTGSFRAATARVYEAFPALGARRHTRAGTLSGGQQQMLILSMATIHEPPFLLLDEPSLGLAPIIVDQVFDFIRSYCASGQRAVVVSEQMATLALRIADQGYVLKRGEVVLQGDAAELRRRGVHDLSSAYLGDLEGGRKA